MPLLLGASAVYLLGQHLDIGTVIVGSVCLGIAVDDGVHFIHRFRSNQGSINHTMQQTGRSILITSLTNLAAFGSLLLTSHRGLQSFAALLCLGISFALLVSLTLLPYILTKSETQSSFE